MTFGLAAAAGWIADQALGEPPARIHPVVWFGTTMRRVERYSYRDTRAAGALHLAVGVGVAAVAGRLLSSVLGRNLGAAVATAVAVAGRMLANEAASIVGALEHGDVELARSRLPSLVGRDVSELDETAILRSVIESVAENTVDAVTAPLLWAAVGGAPAVLGYRAVNTLDAMVGHRNPRYREFGWASARADDVANWLPARLSAVGVACLVPGRAGRVRAAVQRDAPAHPSPNGGVIEAAFAGALGVQLGGVNSYAGERDDRGTLGTGPAPDLATARRAIGLASSLGALIAAAAAIVTPQRQPLRTTRTGPSR